MIQSALFILMLAIGAPCYAATIPQQITYQDTLIIEQNAQVVAIGLASSSSTLPIQVYSSYIPIVFVNNTGLPASQVYVTFQGALAATPSVQQFLSFDPNTAFGSFVTPSSTLFSANYSYQLSSVPQVQGSPGSYLFYIPLVTSGRAYVTLNQPLFVPVAAASPYSVQDPSPTAYTDPNYCTLLDKWEFTFVPSGQTGTNLGWQGNLNSSGVDFFGLSSELQFLSYPSGSLLQTFDPAQANDGPTTFSKDRASLLTTFVAGLAPSSNTAYWSALCLPFLSSPYSNSSPITTYLRILNPGFSITFPPSSYGGAVPFYQNPSAGFPADYLTNAAYGENYMANWFGYYNGTGRQLTVYEDIINPSPTYTGTASGASPNQTFTLTSTGPTETLAQNAMTSVALFTGNSFPFSPANGVLTEYMVGTFEVGEFNYTRMPTISQTNLRANHATYFSNPAFTSTPGPWYDLYGSLLHSQGLIPSYSATGIGAVYASPYDDLLGINSSIAIRNPTDYSVVPNPYANIILNALSSSNPASVVPSISDSGSISVTFQLNVAGSSISYRQGTSGSYQSASSGVPVTITTFPLQVQYISGNSNTVTRYYTIYLKYQNMQPTVVSSNQYNTSDQTIIQTTTIYPADISLGAFTVTFTN